MSETVYFFRNYQENYQQKNSLEMQNSHCEKSKKLDKTINDRSRTSFYVSCPGSLTVETAVVLPMFLLTMFSVLFFFQVFAVYADVERALVQTARELAQAGYVKEESILDYWYVQKRMLSLLAESKLDKSCITKGAGGLSFIHSKFEGEIVDLIVSYNVETPISVLGKSQFPIVQRARVRVWSGSYANKGNAEDAEYVYITPTGTVYHRSQECTYLNLSIQQKSLEQIGILRNYGNEKYSKCERCTSKIEGGSGVYITNYGNRYHVTLTCSGLKRGIITIKLAEVGTKGPCSKCGVGK